MNWILYHGDLFPYHTPLELVLKPILKEVNNFKWLLSDLDFMQLDSDKYGFSNNTELPINFDQDYFILDKYDFEKLLSHEIQYVWGSILGFPETSEISFNTDSPPYVEGNGLIWEAGNMQVSGAIIEIDCFDSGATIVKFSDELLSKKFHDFYPGFTPLETFKG